MTDENTQGTAPEEHGVGAQPTQPKAPEAQNDAPEPKKQEPVPPATVGSVSERLSASAEAGADVTSPDAPKDNSVPFDISKLSTEQLQELKSRLDVVPNRPVLRQQKPTVKLRMINNALVLDFKNAYVGLIDDHENNRKVERHIIPVKTEGSDEYVDVLYSEFISAPQIVATILEAHQTADNFVEGEVISRETGQRTEMLVKGVKYEYTLKLPDDRTIRVPSKIVNA